MLLNLHVKNIALIHEADIDLREGLNIFTGETGAGKSLLLGSVNLALGARPKPGVLRHGADSALVELTFSVEKEKTKALLLEENIQTEEGVLIISRKITGSKSVFRINGEGATAAQVKKIASALLDIHGQHDHQSLLYNDRQLDILDAYSGNEVGMAKEKVQKIFKEYAVLKKTYSEYDLDDRARLREKELIEHELGEIRTADLKDGEEEELAAKVRKLDNAKNILSSLNAVHRFAGYDTGAAELTGRAVQEMASIRDYDEELSEIAAMLNDADALMADIARAVSSYADSFTFSDAELMECTQRLDEIRHIQSKYGGTIEKIQEYENGLEERLSFLENYAEQKAKTEKQIAEAASRLEKAAGELTVLRKKNAKTLSEEIIKELKELNFAGVQFEISFDEKEEINSNGKDRTEFMISVNPGEPLLPLSRIASGGELSRIMLAIKTILAKNDPVETLLFDEIDSGISGRTAAAVANKLSRISDSHQILCITHLAQIAAAADAHFVIEKTVRDNETYTNIKELDEVESENELARILGGTSITEAVLNNARELKKNTARRK